MKTTIQIIMFIIGTFQTVGFIQLLKAYESNAYNNFMVVTYPLSILFFISPLLKKFKKYYD